MPLKKSGSTINPQLLLDVEEYIARNLIVEDDKRGQSDNKTVSDHIKSTKAGGFMSSLLGIIFPKKNSSGSCSHSAPARY